MKEHIPKYKIQQPEKRFRKNPDTYINNKSWNDEIILPNIKNTTKNKPNMYLGQNQDYSTKF